MSFEGIEPPKKYVYVPHADPFVELLFQLMCSCVDWNRGSATERGQGLAALLKEDKK